MSQLPPLHSASSSPAPSPVHARTQSSGGGGGVGMGSTTTVSLGHYSPYSLAAQQSAAAYLHQNQEDKEVICSNMSDRVRLMIDILQLAPPTAEKQPTRDPNLAPSPKPLFGTRPPPAALALQRGFSVGARDRAAAEQRDREAAFALAALPLNGEGISPPNRPSSPLILAPSASYSSSFDNSSPFKSGVSTGGRKEGPLVSGWLSMQKNAGKWKRFWVEYAADGILSYRVDDTTKKPAGTIQVSYVEAEITPLPRSALNPKRKEFEQPLAEAGVTESIAKLSLERSVTTPVASSGGVMLPAIGGSSGSGSSSSSGPPIIPPLMLASPPSTAPLSKFSEDYWRYLEDECAFWTFKVVSPTRVFLFKADNPGSPAALQAQANSSNPAGVLCGEELRNQFVTTMRAHLQQAFSLIPGGASQPVTPSPSLPQLNFNSVADVPQRNASPPPASSGFSSSLQVPSASTSFGGSSSSAQSSSSSNPALPSLLWKQKNECLVDLVPLFHEQFMIQVGRYKALQQALTKPPPHFIEDELPITSTRKEKSGVLCMEQIPGGEETNSKTKSGATLFSAATGAASSSSASASSSSAASSSSSSASSLADGWRDYYFVLFEGALFYYKDSKSTTPTGFITLRYASLVVDPKRLSRQEYVFHVVTPLRTICCKTKHPVALSEWISVLENTLATYAKKNAAGPPTLLPQGSDKNLLKQQDRDTAALAQAQQASMQPYYPPISGMTQTFNKDGSLFEGPPAGLPMMLGNAPRTLSNLSLMGGSNTNLLGGGAGGNAAFNFGGGGANGANGNGGSNPVTPQRGGDRSGGGSGHKPGSSMDSTPPGVGLTNLSPATTAGPGSDRKSSLTVLQNINKWINNELHSTFRDFQALIQHPQGLEAFRRALLRDDDAGGSGGPASTPKGGANTPQNAHLDFYLASVEYSNLFTNPLFPPSVTEVIQLASQMFLRFLTPSNPAEFLAETTEEQRGIIEDQLPSPSPTTFDGVRMLTQSILQGEFHEFKRTPEFAALGETLNRSVVEDKREIDQFESQSQTETEAAQPLLLARVSTRACVC